MISKILKTLMFKRDINTSQLARGTSLHQQTVHRIVTGESPNPHDKTLKPIADFFNLSVDQLRGRALLPKSTLELDMFPEPNASKKIPVMSISEVLNYLENPDNFPQAKEISIDDKDKESDFAIILPDMSMEPYFPQNSILILSTNKEVKDHAYALIKLSSTNSLIFRQLIFDADDKYLKAMNPNLEKFPMRLMEDKDSILGVLTEVRHKY